ncbi:MAG: NifU family protein [Tepidisphaeraceae bacterium]|jgi:Fe-S cluster biogenesis protein NfuA
MSPEQNDFRRQFARMDGLLREAENFADPNARAKTREIVRILMELHGAAIEKILEHLANTSETGQALIDSLARDQAIENVLLLYNLHPLDVETRVRQALENVGPKLKSHGGSVELVEIDDGAVRLRLHGSCHGCPSSAFTLKTTIEEAIYQRAPEVTAIEVVSDEPIIAASQPGRFALPILSA